jgi:hypothetical protein
VLCECNGAVSGHGSPSLPGTCSNDRGPGVSEGAETSAWAWRIVLAEGPIPELRRSTLKMMRAGFPVTVEVTSDGAGLVSHAAARWLPSLPCAYCMI